MRAQPALLSLALLSASLSVAQTIHVDTSHPTNRFVPNQTLGAGVDRIPVTAIDKDLVEPNLSRALESGWQPVTYRQNTELAVEAWHWNPNGTWSEPGNKGYFVGAAEPKEFLRYSYGYRLPHRGFTRNDGTGNAGYSRLTDGDLNTYWKSNPYLSEHFTHENDALHAQWVIIDLAQPQVMNALRIAWANPYALEYEVQYWTGEDPVSAKTKGVWQQFQGGAVRQSKGGTVTLRLSSEPQPIRFLRILMSKSSNTCDTHGSGDVRNCVGFAISELYVGTLTGDDFHDIARHTPDQEQTTTYCSSVDPWHDESDLAGKREAQVGFDLFYQSGVTRGLPAMVPVAMIYETPENSAAEIAYIEKRGYPISYIEMGEEADGQYMTPEDNAALYIQWAEALHRVDPKLKLGGPSFQGVNKDIEIWPDASGRVSWTARFVDYLRSHGHLQDLAFFSFEHYPLEPCKNSWGALYDEPSLVSHILQVWRDDGVPENVPLFITESNLSWNTSETFADIFSGLWLGDYIGSFLTAGGNGVYIFHYLPLPAEHGCNDSPGSFGFLSIDKNYNIQQPLAQFWVSQIINKEWVQPGSGEHEVFPAHADIDDGAGHALVTAYALKRPDGEWSLLVVNRDQSLGHKVRVAFDGANAATFGGTVDIVSFGSAEYLWHPDVTKFLAHTDVAGENSVISETKGHADPDNPPKHTTVNATAATEFELPAASVTVIRGKRADH
jgi:hypothetical protein